MSRSALVQIPTVEQALARVRAAYQHRKASSEAADEAYASWTKANQTYSDADRDYQKAVELLHAAMESAQ